MSSIVVYVTAAALAGLDLTAFPTREVTLRGRESALVVRVIGDAGALPERRPPRGPGGPARVASSLSTSRASASCFCRP